MTLRTGTQADAPALARILSDWIDQTDWMPRIHTHEEDAGFLRYLIDTADVSVAETDKCLGFLALSGQMISALYVEQSARNTGFGKMLLDNAKRQRSRLELWTFQANVSAQRFYLREGFSELRRTNGDNEEGLPDVQLEWSKPQ